MAKKIDVLIVTSKSPGWSMWTAVYVGGLAQPIQDKYKLCFDQAELAEHLAFISTKGAIASLKHEHVPSVSSVHDFISLLNHREGLNAYKSKSVLDSSPMAQLYKA
jgi:hypothetical protein